MAAIRYRLLHMTGCKINAADTIINNEEVCACIWKYNLNPIMKREFLQEVIIGLLVVLFVYTGGSKLLDIHGFVAGMKLQPFAAWVNKTVALCLPATEIIIALGLGFEQTRKTALYIYGVLMFCFTVYTGLVVAGFFEHRPCGCGGIISRLSWEGHFIINLIFLMLTCAAIWLHRRNRIFMHNQGVSRKPAKE